MSTLLDRYRGAIVGVAVGDMVGLAVETASAENVRIYLNALSMLGRRFGLEEFLDPFEYKKGRRVYRPAGQVSDDTLLTVALAQSLIECGFDPADQYRRYRELVHEDAVCPVTGTRMYGAGSLTRAVTAFETLEESRAARDLPERPSNGAMMRTAPIALRYMNGGSGVLIENARDASLVTHRHPLSGDCCAFYVLVLNNLLLGYQDATVTDIVADAWDDLMGDANPWLEAVVLSTETPEAQLDDPGLMPGSALWSLSVALWALRNAPDFETGITEVIKLGGDTDTNAAIAGGLLGARFCYSGIPQDWREGVMGNDKLVQLADELYERSGRE